MHGRVKVRTTAEQEKIKQAEKLKKAAEFKKVIELVFKKRNDQEWDEELLLLTEKIVVRYPDVYTLWNIRREVFLHIAWSNELRVEKLEKELILTENSLRENPKSYCVWHQRTWVIEKLPNPNWKREIDLCNKCLNLDERNFHCWDYRQFIVNKANISDKEELEFTTTKILSNFSNYSSWHYRSRLLRKLYPSNVHDLPIQADKHNEELDLVMNATFTDPNDSSAWFYHRWLLDYWKSTNKLWRVVLTKTSIIAAFHQQVPLNLELFLDDKRFDCKWKSLNGKKSSIAWYAEFEQSLDQNYSEVALKFEENLTKLNFSNSTNEWIYQSKKLCGNHNNPKLKEQLENYQTLVEMEPNNKWAKLTSTHLMLNINAIERNANIVEELNGLIKVDPLRANYYKDIRSKCILEYKLNSIELDDNKENEKNMFKNIDLSNLELTSLSNQEPYFIFFEEINLRNNQLGKRLTQLYCLRNCVLLDLSNNEIKSLTSFPTLHSLKVLLLSDNEIADSNDVLDVIRRHNLKKLDLKGNPCINKDSIVNEIKQNFSNLELLV